MIKFPKTLITGCGGMLGNAVLPYFQSQCEEILASDLEARAVEKNLQVLDVRDVAAARQMVSAFKPDLILHLAAETDLEYCEEHADIAEATNAWASGEIAKLAEEFGCTLVYISTAGVFDGEKMGFYTEADQPVPIMVYGQTKYDGELLVRQYCSRHYVVRAGWMVGGGQATDHKFVSKILDQLIEGRDVIHAVDDRWGTPTYTHDFARNLFRLLDTEAYGTYHMVCEGFGTRFDVASEIVAISGRTDVEVLPVSSDFFKEEYFAPRPRSEMMENAKLAELNINSMRPWREALRHYMEREYPNVITQPALSGTEASAKAGSFSGKDGACRRTTANRRQQVSGTETWIGTERRNGADRRDVIAGSTMAAS